MHNVTTSRHIRTSSELMIMVPIKNDFVPITELVMSYAARISLVLQALAEVRQLKVERGFSDPIGPIEQLQTIYRVQWTVIEPFDDVTTRQRAVTRQLHTPQVVLTSHFDSTWETYFQALVDTGGPLLDLIFSHCQDYEGCSCKDGYEGFANFIRRHQRRCDFLYATAPEITIDDVRYFSRLSTNLLGNVQGPLRSLPQVKAQAGTLIHEQLKVPGHGDRTRAALRAVHGLYDIRQRLFLEAGGIQTGAKPRKDRALFDDAVASTLKWEPDFYRLGAALLKRQAANKPISRDLGGAARWAADLIDQAWKEDPKTPRPDQNARPNKSPLEKAAAALPELALTVPADIEALLHDVQGNILNSFPSADQARLVLVRCHDREGMQELLTWAARNFSSEKDSRSQRPLSMSIALSHYGLQLLELPQEALAQFPREFREGMEERAGLIGDVAENHPKHWKLPLHAQSQQRMHLSTVHLAFVIHGKPQAIAAAIQALEAANPNGEIVHTLPLDPHGRKEISQPLPPTKLQANAAPCSALDVQALGEFILGHKNKLGRQADCADPERNPAWANLFKNGSFIAMRKMRKDDKALASYIHEVAKQITRNDEPTQAEQKEVEADLEALIAGRRSDGKMLGSLQPKPEDPANAFDYSSDPEGISCPFHSHARRSNPRDGNAPRIVRRGLEYRADELGEYGLLFMAYCANLSGQYEIVQRWVNGGNSTGVLSRQNDPLCGAPSDTFLPRVVNLAATAAAKLPNAPSVVALPPPAAAFVELRWGMYLFAPARAALELLCTFKPEDSAQLRDAAVARGAARIAELEQMPNDVRMHEWKRLLEEVPEADSPQALHARDVAAAITELKQGALHFKGAPDPQQPERELDIIVVTKAELASKVLSKSDQFSVSKYHGRLNEALADHYLGYDKLSLDERTGLTYADVSTKANLLFEGLHTRAENDQEAQHIAERLLHEPETIQLDPDGEGGPDVALRNTIAVRDLATAVIGELCHEWLDMPAKDRAKAQRPEDVDNTRGWMDAVERLLVASRYCFQAMPVKLLAEKAGEERADINRDYDAIAQPRSQIGAQVEANFVAETLRRDLDGAKAGEKLPTQEVRRLIKTVLLGAVGFAPPAVGAVTRILDYWIETEKLWRIQRAFEKDPSILRGAITEALSKVPAPPTLFRTATAKATALGSVADVPEGAIVIINLAAVYEDAVRNNDAEPEKWFFGGEHGGATGNAPQHGCPGRRAGMAAMEQIIASLLRRKNIRRERRMLLSYDREELPEN